MSESLKDKTVVVTGGGTGIGLGITQCCLEAGASVMIAQRRIEIAREKAALLKKSGYQVEARQCDVSLREDVTGLVAETVETFGSVDVMINNAALTGQAAECRPFMDETDEHWRNVLDINLTGAFIGTQEAARQMIKQGSGGAIINISSVAQFAAQEGAAPYCASKAGMDGLAKTAAIELAPHNIRVNNIAPGDIYTEQSADVVGTAAERGATGKYFRYTPLGRRGEANEIGQVAVFLAGDGASFVTGATWLVDGGFLCY